MKRMEAASIGFPASPLVLTDQSAVDRVEADRRQGPEDPGPDPGPGRPGFSDDQFEPDLLAIVRSVDAHLHVGAAGVAELEDGGSKELVRRGLLGGDMADGPIGPASRRDLDHDAGSPDRL